MSKFLEGNVRKYPFTVEEERLTEATLRSLIPGDFHIEKIHPGQSAKLGQMTSCYVLFHEKGIFVISRCNQDGIIHGDILDEQWTSFNYLGDATVFPNPIAINQQNITVLSQLLKLPKPAFHSCLLFPSLSELRKVPSNNAWQGILLEDELESYFSDLLPSLEPCYTHTQLDALHDIFLLVTADVAI